MDPRQLLSGFHADQAGAVAPTYAIAITALVAIAGVGFDYGRMASLDTELQNASDQAALAGASQLDGRTGACSRASGAVTGFVANSTRFANDGAAPPVTFQNEAGCDATGSIRFWQDKEKVTGATTDANARYIEVITDVRTARYALTPIVGAITSGQMGAAAMAGVGSSVCKIPPLFICKPDAAIADPIAWINSIKGKGILLKAKGTQWFPGNYGFLDTGAGNGASTLAKLLAYASPPGECVSVDQVTTESGQKQSVVADFNTRFDMYENGDNINCYSSDSLCPPAANSRKDIVQPKAAAPTKLKDCNSPAGGWVFSNRPYRPTTASLITGAAAANFPDAMGLPRDLCHAVDDGHQNCTDGFIGNGSWDINAYWWANYGSAWSGAVSTNVAGRTYPTRYEIYQWEKTNAAAFRDIPGSTLRNYKAAICRSPGADVPDRRVIPIAVVDCSELNSGHPVVKPLAFMDVLLTEPSIDRSGNDIASKNATFTSKGDFYGEVVGVNGQGSGGASQQVRRDVPSLVR